MTSKVYDFKANNRKQVLEEADYIRGGIEYFNENSPEYKIDRLVLASNKLSSLYSEEDTIYVSFKNTKEPGYKDNGFVMQGADTLTVEIHKAQAQKAFESVEKALKQLTNSGIIKFKPLIELETSNYFKKNVAKEIYNASSYKNSTSLLISFNIQKDFFDVQGYNYRVDKLKERTVKTAQNKNNKTFKP